MQVLLKKLPSVSQSVKIIFQEPDEQLSHETMCKFFLPEISESWRTHFLLTISFFFIEEFSSHIVIKQLVTCFFMA